MATWAMFYNPQDFSAMAGSLQAGILSNAHRTESNRYWQGGLNAWAASPAGVSPCDDPLAPENAGTTRCVMSVNQRTLTDFKTFLRTLAATYPTLEWLRGLANDLDGCSGAWEPWPPV